MKEKQKTPAVRGRSIIDRPKTAKRILALLLTVATLATSLCLPAFAVEEGATVTLEQVDGYYLIGSAEDFLQIANDLTAKYKLTADLEFEDALPAGKISFQGTLDGDGHTMTIKNSCAPKSSQGIFFSNLTNATIQNLQLGTKDCPITVTSLGSSAANVGIIADYAKGAVTITNVHIYANVNLTAWERSPSNFGIFFARASSAESLTIDGCSANGTIQTSTVTGTKKLGGFVATFGAPLTIKNCVNNVDMTGSTTGSMYVGGFGGNIAGTMTLENCVNTGTISFENKGTNTLKCDAFYTLASGGSATPSSCVNLGTVNGEAESEINLDDLLVATKGIITQTNKGAGVRIVLDGKGTGLRFTFTMDDASIAMLAALTEDFGADNVQVGAIFLPTDLLKEGKDLTAENYANALVREGKASAVKDGYYYASLVNLFENHYETEYSCQSFYRFRTSADGEWITVYANNTESRTIKDVATEALAAIENGQDTNHYTEEQITLLNQYAAGNPTVEATN